MEIVNYAGVDYKRGRFGFTYRWSGNYRDWVRSSRDWLELEKREAERVARVNKQIAKQERFTLALQLQEASKHRKKAAKERKRIKNLTPKQRKYLLVIRNREAKKAELIAASDEAIQAQVKRQAVYETGRAERMKQKKTSTNQLTSGGS